MYRRAIVKEGSVALTGNWVSYDRRASYPFLWLAIFRPHLDLVRAKRK